MSPAAARAAVSAIPPAQPLACEGAAAGACIADGATVLARRHRANSVTRFRSVFGGLDGWAAAPLGKRLAAAADVRAGAACLAPGTAARVDPACIAQANVSRGWRLADLDPRMAARFTATAAALGWDARETERQWCTLSKLAACAGRPAQTLDRPAFETAREALAAAVTAHRGRLPWGGRAPHHPAPNATSALGARLLLVVCSNSAQKCRTQSI